MTAPSQELVRGALAAAQTEAAVPDSAALAQMVCAVQRDAVERLTPAQRGQVQARAMMAPYPVGFFRALRDCGGLRRLLPEVDALLGVPLIANVSEPVDVGEHQMRVLAETARRRLRARKRLALRMSGLSASEHARARRRLSDSVQIVRNASRCLRRAPSNTPRGGALIGLRRMVRNLRLSRSPIP